MRVMKFAGLALLLACGVTMVTGCVSYRVDGVFTQPTLTSYDRFVVYGLQENRKQVLMSSFLRAFPGGDRTFIEGQNLLRERDVEAGQLAEDKRRQIAQILGVEAIVLASYKDYVQQQPEHHREVLSVRIVDASTGEIAGSVVVSASSEKGTKLNALPQKAVLQLRASLMQKAGRTGRASSETVMPSKRNLDSGRNYFTH